MARAVFIGGAGDDAIDEGGMLRWDEAERGHTGEFILHEDIAFGLHGLGIMHLVGGEADCLKHFTAGFLAAADDKIILGTAYKGGQKRNALCHVEAVGIAFAGSGEFDIDYLPRVKHIHAAV